MIGVAGGVDLTFGRRGSRSVLAHARVDAPMQVVRPFELPDGRVVVQLITLGPGLCAGDAIEVSVAAVDGAGVVITTPAASRIMAMANGEQAAQRVSLRVEAGASLEYYPAVTIPFPGSSFVQTIAVAAAAGARVGLVEIWALGRQARGEYLQFARLSSRTTLTVNGAIAYADATEIAPGEHEAAGAAILAGRRYAASGFWLGAAIDDADPLTAAGDATLTAFAPSRPDLVYLRALAPDAPSMDAVLRRSLERMSDAWGVPPVRLDRFKC